MTHNNNNNNRVGDWPFSVLYNPLGHIHIHRHKNSHSALLLLAVFKTELVKWLETLNTGQCLHAQTGTHTYINIGVIFWWPLPLVAAGDYLVEQRIWTGPYIEIVVLLFSMGDSHFCTLLPHSRMPGA